MMNLLTFSSLMAQRANALPVRVNAVKQEVAKSVLAGISQLMPVDTGLAVSNTMVSLGGANGFVRAPFAPGMRGNTRNENVRATIAAGVSVIATATPGQSIHITNSVPYVEELNSGSSRQAPAGFVENAVLIGKQVIHGATVIT